MNTRRNWLRNSGFTLIEVMIAAAIGAIVLMGMMSWTDHLLTQQKAMSQKMVSLELANALQSVMANTQQCSQNMTLQAVQFPTGSSTYTLPATATVNIYNVSNVKIGTAIPAGVVPNGYGLAVQNIQFQNLNPVVPGTYSATLVVNFTGTVIPLNPITYPIFLNTVTAGPNQQVQSCGSTICGSNFVLIGSGGTEQFCISKVPEPPTNNVLTAFQNCENNTLVHGLPSGQTAHLCTPDEWTSACIEKGAALGLPPPAVQASEEWVYQPEVFNNGNVGQQGGVVMGGTGGSNFGGTCIGYESYANQIEAPGGYSYGGATNSPYGYRCCYRN